jgi:serine/threonine protein kinase
VEKIGKYTIIERIGKGGMGIVYKALDPRIGRVVAVKTIFTHGDEETEYRRRFFQEARSAGTLSHKNIITIYEMDEDQGQIFIVMEYLEGEDLRSLIRGHMSETGRGKSDRLKALEEASETLEQKLRYLIEVCEGLAHAHEREILHRDIKPANIFITLSGQVKILDFGLARAFSSDQTKSSVIMGTPLYMSPEQVRGERLDHRSDIFSFGVVAYELITSISPFKAETDYATLYKVTNFRPAPVDKMDATVPPELGRIIATAMEKEAGKRYQQADELVRELEAVKGLLEERKRLLREEVRTGLAELEALVQANRELLETHAEKLADLKETAPEIFDETRTIQTGERSLKRRMAQFDYLTLIQMRDRLRAEIDRLPALLEKRRKAKQLLLEAAAFQKGGELENALKLLAQILREDPDYTAAQLLKREITATLAAEQQARRLADLLHEGQSCLASGDLDRCCERMDELLQLQPDHPEATALRQAARQKLEEAKRILEQQRRAEIRLSEARKALSNGDFQQAKAELEEALREVPALAGADELCGQIEAAVGEAEARAVRIRKIDGLLAEARDLTNAGKDDQALSVLSELLDLENQHAEALELRSSIRAKQLRQGQADDLCRQAAAKLAENHLFDAQALLLQTLELAPTHREAESLLELARGKIQEQERVERQRNQGIAAIARARAHLVMGRWMEARTELDLALQAHPEVPGASSVAQDIAQAEEKEKAEKEKAQKIESLLSQARSRMESGGHDQALALAARALEIQPSHIRALDLKDEIEDLRRNAERSAQRRRERISAVLNRAREAATQGDFAHAIDQALSIEAEPETAAEVKEFLRQWQSELARRRKIEEQNRSKIERLLVTTRSLIAAKAFPEARRSLQAILDLQVDHPEALDLLKQLQLQVEAEKSRQAREEEGLLQKKQGLHLLSEKKYRESLGALRLAANLLEEDSVLHLSIQQAEAGLRAEESRTQIQAGLVEARRLISAESYDAAEAALLKILALAPENAEARELLDRIQGILAQQRARARIAEMLARARQSLGQRDFQAASRLASEILLFDTENLEAKELLKRIDVAQQEKARRLEIAVLLAQSSQALSVDDFAQAASHAREVLLLDAQNADALALLKRIDEAQESRHRADRVSGLLLQGRQERSRGDLDAALTHVQEILRLEPAHKEARSFARDLEKEIRAREKERERQRKLQALEQERAKSQRPPDGDATVILKRQQEGIGTGARWIRTPWIIGLACLVIAAAIFLWSRYAGEKAGLAIVSDPDGVSIRLDGREFGSTASGRLVLSDLSPGTFTLAAQKEGYTPTTRAITLRKGEVLDLTLKLAPLAAELLIRAAQPAVTVEIDGKILGQTANAGRDALFRVESGFHAVVLRKEGFEDVRRELKFTPGETLTVIESLKALVVAEGSAGLRVLTDPPGATVYLDGMPQGMAASGSLTFKDRKPGPVRLAVKMNGYVDSREKTVQLEVGRVIDEKVTLSPKNATLSLSTNLPGAEVFIDNLSAGVTDAGGNFRSDGIQPGSRTVKVSKQGYQDKIAGPYVFKPGETVSIPITLVAAAAPTASVNISSTPPGAELFIDNQLRGNTPVRIVIEPGVHTLKLRKEGYREAPERSITLRAGDAREEPPFVLERARGTLQFDIQPEGATVTIGSTRIDTAKQKSYDLDAGAYNIELSFPDYKPLPRQITVQDQKTLVIREVLERIPVAIASSYNDAFLSLSNWNHPATWQANAALRLMRATGSGFAILKDRDYDSFEEYFQIRINKGVMASWVIRWQDSRNYCLIQINSARHTDKSKTQTIYFYIYKNGTLVSNPQNINIPLPFGKNRDDVLQVATEVKGENIFVRAKLVSGSDVKEWVQLSHFTIPAGLLPLGKVGFFIQNDEELEIGGFIINPAAR